MSDAFGKHSFMGVIGWRYIPQNGRNIHPRAANNIYLFDEISPSVRNS